MKFVKSLSRKIDPYRLLLNLIDKINLKRNDKYVIALSNLSIYYTWKNIKKSYKNNKFKISVQYGMKSLSYLMDHILYQIFKITLNIFKKHGEKTDNLSTRIYVNEREKRITFTTKTGYYLQ